MEDMIRQRILDGSFDDVEAKVAIEVKGTKKRADVSDEKSKQARDLPLRAKCA